MMTIKFVLPYPRGFGHALLGAGEQLTGRFESDLAVATKRMERQTYIHNEASSY
jgi:hypothetical protein